MATAASSTNACVSLNTQDVGDMALEVAFPRSGICRVPDEEVRYIEAVMSALQNGDMYGCEDYGGDLLSGSRPERFAMDDDWGHDATDWDYMNLRGGPLGVHVPGGHQSQGRSCLVFSPEGCPAAYTKLQITDLPTLRMYHSWIDQSIDKSGDKCWLNTFEAVRMMRYGVTISGPAAQLGTRDWVSALVCSGPLPHMQQEFTNRPRQWPFAALISELLKLPMLLVLVGHRLSPEFNFLARLSWSYLELKLIQQLPEGVRHGYIAFKYTMKRLLKCNRGETEASDGRSHVCSYHFKTVFLRYLETRPPPSITSPFQLYLDLLTQLDAYLEAGKLPHYFLAECNLLETVPGEERHIARQAIQHILSDPLNALLTSPTTPQQIYGEVCPEHLVSAFCKASSHPMCAQSLMDLSGLLARVDQRRRQKYREQLEMDINKRVSGRAELTGLVEMMTKQTNKHALFLFKDPIH